MPTVKDDLDHIVKLFTALSQRNDQMAQLATMLASGAFWRSPAGDLEVKITPEHQTQMEDIIRTYTQECETILARLKQCLPPTE